MQDHSTTGNPGKPGDQPPIIVSRLLARELGINEAIALHRLHELVEIAELENNDNSLHLNLTWVPLSLDEWQIMMPWCSVDEIDGILWGLEGWGVTMSAKINIDKGDNRRWYTVIREGIAELIKEMAQ